MQKKRDTKNQIHYFSDRLKRKLEALSSAPATIIEAPSGYGKTTAVQDHLERIASQNTPLYWYNAVDESHTAAYRRLCREIEKIDPGVGERLTRLGLPNAATIGEACDILRSIECKRETYLVIDNFHLLNGILPPALLLALIEHGGSGLHIIITTHMLGKDNLTAVAGKRFLHLTASDLRLDAGDIRKYYALAGTDITREEAQRVAVSTEGWIIAVYLQLCAYQETGNFSETAILSLMENLIWNRLTPEQQDFFLRLAPFTTATAGQICGILGVDRLPDYALAALKLPFVEYDPAEKRYTPHSILYELAVQKCRERGEDFERECLLRAGDLCRDEGKTAEALGFYWRIKDYERILALDLSPLLLEKFGDSPFSDIALELARRCPTQIKNRYPLSMLHTALALKTAGMDTAFHTLLEELRPIVEEDAQEPWLLGEWLLLSSLRHQPDLPGMTALLREAEPLFAGKTSRVILPWSITEGGPFPMYYAKPGEADRGARDLEEYTTLYTKLTGGNGSGADALYSAQLAYHRGDLHNAEILAYKAMYLAQSKQQSFLQLGAALSLAQVALHKADTHGWQNAISSMERAAVPLQDSFAFRAVLDINRGMLFNELMQLDGIAPWLKEGDFSVCRLLPGLTPAAVFVHAHYLMHTGQFARLIGLVQVRYPDGVPNSPLMDMLLSLTAAVGYFNLNDHIRAKAMIHRAADLTLPDGVIFPFASYSLSLGGLVEEIIEREHPELLATFDQIKERFITGWNKLFEDLNPRQLPEALTDREREIAVLASQGLRNSEIASRLFVSENTVRTHLHSVFQKLDVDRRAKLAEKLK